MQVILQYYRPVYSAGKGRDIKVRGGALRRNYVRCPGSSYEQTLETCLDCPSKQKINFNTVECNYVRR